MNNIIPFRIYKDLDLNFLSHPDTEDVTKVVDTNSVKQAIKILVLSQFNERLFQPDVGSPIFGLLFEPLDEITTELLKQSITQVISNHEPRCVLNGVSVIANPDINAYNITIYYTVIGIPLPVTFSFTLKRLQ